MVKPIFSKSDVKGAKCDYLYNLSQKKEHFNLARGNSSKAKS